MSRPTASWTTPDPVRGPGPATLAEPELGPSPVAAAEATPDLATDARAGAAAAVALVLLGAPVGLLWALVAPKVSVVITGTDIVFPNPDRSAFIAADGAFLAIVFTVGLVTGALAWLLGRRHGPALVLGLAVGGLLAAYVASRTGALLNESEARDLVEAGRSGAADLAVRLRATEAVLGWPVAALIGFVVPSVLFDDEQSTA